MSERQVNGLAVRAMRLKAQMTTKALAEASGVAESTIEGIEAGRRKYLADATITGLATALKIDLLAFMEAVLIQPPPGERTETDHATKHPVV